MTFAWLEQQIGVDRYILALIGGKTPCEQLKAALEVGGYDMEVERLLSEGECSQK